MIVTPKLKNPILININMQTVQIDDQNFPLDQFVSGDHYGISIVKRVDNMFSIIDYPTQFPIVRVTRSTDALNQIFVYEEGKSYSWQFTLDGIYIAPALFEPNSSKDLEYSRLKNIGMHPLDLEYINSEMKDFIEKEIARQK